MQTKNSHSQDDYNVTGFTTLDASVSFSFHFYACLAYISAFPVPPAAENTIILAQSPLFIQVFPRWPITSSYKSPLHLHIVSTRGAGLSFP